MSLEQYVESIEDDLEEYGIGRIVPPKGWTPRKQGYGDVDFRVEKAITQHATGRKGLFRTLLVEKKPLSVKHDFAPMASLPENQPSKSAMDDPTFCALEREFWKKVAYDPPTYCADVAGTLFDKEDENLKNSNDENKITSGWDVSRLDSLLSRTLKEKNITLDGVNSSYLYFGMWRSLFAWHTEDCDLYSVNYLHYGAPKFWYAIAPEDRERFEILAQGMVPEMWRNCPEFLRHKELLISPTLLEQNGIPFTRMMQQPGEFVVTYPGSYHSGFNCGYNCAESCNFATEAWVEIGEDAGVCECVSDAVSLDMRIFGDLCTRCHDTDSDSESESDSQESDSDESDDDVALADYRKGKKYVTGTSRKHAIEVDSDSDDVSVSGTKRKPSSGKKTTAPKRVKKEERKEHLTSDSQKVSVPTGWTRSVVMRGTTGAPKSLGSGRPKSTQSDRDTYYTAPCGAVVKSKYEVMKYLGSNPNSGAKLKDFYFESMATDVPPARLAAPPGTPSPTASADTNRRNSAGTSRGQQSAASEFANSEKKAIKGIKKEAVGGVKKEPGSRKQTEKDRRGSGGRDALGLLKNGATGATVKKTVKAPVKLPVKKHVPVKVGSGPLVTSAQKAAGSSIDSKTFSSWKAGGVLENAVAKVMRRAGSVGKYAYGIRGSSLVMQVEQALGVGSGALKEHGRQIQSLAAKRRA